MVILDFNGTFSGVGRCTIQMLRQLELDAVPSLLTGTDEFVHRFRSLLPDLKQVQFKSLDRPRFGFRHLHLRHLRKSAGDPGRYSDSLIQLTRQKSAQLLPEGHRGKMVNYALFTPPPSRERGYAILIHDLNWRHFPENFFNPDKTDYWCRAWVESAGRVIANSEFTRREIIEQYGCAPDKVVAAPLAPYAVPDADSPATSAAALARLGLKPGEFFFYPNGWGLHKGFDVLTDAIEQAGDIPPVVLTCGKPEGRSPGIQRLYVSLQERWSRLVAQKKLVLSGWLDDAEVQALRRHCRAFVLPNLFEGFGFPMAEALYHYRPAIVSEIPSHREILDRYPKYHLAKTFPARAADALAVELRNFKPVPVPVPADWAGYVESTWSWRHTMGRVLPAVSS